MTDLIIRICPDFDGFDEPHGGIVPLPGSQPGQVLQIRQVRETEAFAELILFLATRHLEFVLALRDGAAWPLLSYKRLDFIIKATYVSINQMRAMMLRGKATEESDPSSHPRSKRFGQHPISAGTM